MQKGEQMNYKIKQGQSIYDLALLYGYGIENVVQFLADAPQLISLDNIRLGGIDIDVTKRTSLLSDFLNLYATGIASGQTVDANWLMDDDGNLILDADGYGLFTT
jgi:uncharacterized ubiquitin-like protein YukD